jgi:hypothetical protein
MDKAVCTTQRNVQLSRNASQPNESVLSANGICATHYHLSQKCFVARLVAWLQYLPCRQRRHCTVTTHNRFHDIKRAMFSSTIGDEFPPVWHFPHKNWNVPLKSTFDLVCRRLVYKMIVRRQDKLVVTSHGCTKTRTTYICLLRGDIHSQIIMLHGKVSLLFLLLYISPWKRERK